MAAVIAWIRLAGTWHVAGSDYTPPVTGGGDFLTTEAGDFLTTESGDFLIS